MRRAFLNPYFRIRSTVPHELRLMLRRSWATRALPVVSGSWPINPLAGAAPTWWRGWPNNKKFAFVLTHDAEGQTGLNRCRELAEMELSLGFSSSFNFVPEGEYRTPRSLRDLLTGYGFEVGVHDFRHDGRLFSSRRHFKLHAPRINQYLQEWGAVGFRSGFMLHNFDWLRDLNILYDASSFDTDPFEPQPEGVNTIFPLWVDRGTGSGYVELPYTLPQDSTLFLLLRQSGIDTWIDKLDWVAQHGGLALVNVHPDYLSFDRNIARCEYRAQLYQQFLEYAAKKYRQEAWFALPKEVAAHVRSVRSSFAENPDTPLGSDSSTGNRSYSPIPPVTSTRKETMPGHATASSDWELCGKRVAMVMFSFYPGDPRPRRAAEALVAKGMHVDLICLAQDGTDARRELCNGINVLRIPIQRRRGSILTYAYQYSTFLMAASSAIALRSMARKYDVIYVHNMPDFLVVSGLLPKLFGAKVILDLHDPMPELMTAIFGFQSGTFPVRLLKWVERGSILLADSVVTVNRACARLFTSRSCRLPKMHVVMNAPDEGIFRFRPALPPIGNIKASDKPFVIMYHGSLVERNGLDLAIEALVQVRRSIPKVRLKIYGSRTPFLDEAMDSARKMGLQEAIEYCGPRSLEQVATAITECDLGVIPNRKNVFTELNTPTRIFEYLALGKPVIAPRAAGICDYFEDESLVFFELGNAADLAEKIVYVFSNSGKVCEIVRRGQQVYQQHKWSSERTRLISLVTELLSSRSRVEAGSLLSESPNCNL
jgi:glycosyltransferase involved in cell wall biosynthesis